jgi:peptidoglycan/LPS O-acetylase OafA/YrhL
MSTAYESSMADTAGVRDKRMPRLPILDGWRGISILAVLAAHLAPLGPHHLQLNDAAGVFGMAIFFTLSGFLITSTLFFHPSVRTFAIRRLCRIVPAAWLYLLIMLPIVHAGWHPWLANFLFYANLPPFYLTKATSAFWSLGVEIQFYFGIGLAFFFLRQRSLALLPFACMAITLLRIHTGTFVSIVTLYRVDEILAGGALAYLFHGSQAQRVEKALARINPIVPLVLLLIASHPAFPKMNYARPYFAAALVGTTLFRNGTLWSRVLLSRFLAYMALISYAVYIWHQPIQHGWFAQGSKVAIYAKRPVGLAFTFLAAHLSTKYFESYWIKLGKRLTRAKQPKGDVAAKTSEPNFTLSASELKCQEATALDK